MASVAPQIYLLPGMTAEYPVFARLAPLLPDATVVSFIEPDPGESLANYAARMADRFPQPCYIAGVSFGGILALEISRIVQPAGCIMISSVCGPRDLPPWLRVWRTLIGSRNSSRILKLVGDSATLVPKRIRTVSTVRATKLAGDAGKWHRWATSAVLEWQPDPRPLASPILKIHGDADTTFPIRYTEADIVVPGGRHDLPISHPIDTANAIVAFMKLHNPPEAPST